MSGGRIGPKAGKKLAKALEDQGCKTREIAGGGYWVGFPDGKTSTTFHLTQSDPRSLKNLASYIKAAGLVMPKI
jgi:hypothetical protein